MSIWVVSQKYTLLSHWWGESVLYFPGTAALAKAAALHLPPKSKKEWRKNYEKTHILEGEDLFILKALLEKDPNIAKKAAVDSRKADFAKGKIGKDISGKVIDSTVFSKGNNTLTKETIEKIKEKIAKTE